MAEIEPKLIDIRPVGLPVCPPATAFSHATNWPYFFQLWPLVIAVAVAPSNWLLMIVSSSHLNAAAATNNRPEHLLALRNGTELVKLEIIICEPLEPQVGPESETILAAKMSQTEA